MGSTIEHQRTIVAEHIRSENEHNWSAVYSTFVQDDRAHYDVVPLGAIYRGIGGVRKFYESIAAAFPDLHIDIKAEYDLPGCSIREVIVSGTHKGEYAGVKASGKKIKIEMAAFYLFDHHTGKLISEKIYYDQAGVISQMKGIQAAAVA